MTTGTHPLARLRLMITNNHLILLFLFGMILLTSAVLSHLSAVLEVSKPTEWWLGWTLIEFSRIAVVIVLITRFFTVRLQATTVQYKLFQRFFIKRLARAETPHERQRVVDQMMVENLLQQADLSGAQLSEIHLEGADLTHARLWRADLSRADLESANLQDAWLGEANLRYAKLTSANLHGAELGDCTLEHSNLANANLGEAKLKKADLRRASLYDAELEQACLDGADLCGSYLLYANLRDASLQETRFDEATVLPDGTNWTSNTDMSRFTEAQHPDFAAYDGPDATIFKERKRLLSKQNL